MTNAHYAKQMTGDQLTSIEATQLDAVLGGAGCCSAGAACSDPKAACCDQDCVGPAASQRTARNPFALFSEG